MWALCSEALQRFIGFLYFAGDTIKTFTATDADSATNNNNVLSYAIKSKNRLLSIHFIGNLSHSVNTFSSFITLCSYKT